ncbi:MAG: hypothetical protein P9L97_00295 [Candidatus Tenebribacter davisii]|nr:hypothetical protein [Candidatus Tenebribacter davisii]
MRKGMFIIFLISIIALNLNAWISETSFRMKGLGHNLIGFVNDDYSNLYSNPAYAKNFNDLHIFTNLSNMQTPTANLMGQDVNFIKNKIYPSNLIGAIGQWKSMHLGLLYETNGFGIKGNYKYESIDEDYNSYEDEWYTDYNNEEYSAETNFGGNTLVALAEFKLSNLPLGLMFRYNSFNANVNYEYSQKRKMTNEEENSIIVSEENESAEFKTENNMYSLTAGTLLGDEDNELSISAGIRPLTLSLNSGFFDEYFDPNYWFDYNPDEDYGSEYYDKDNESIEAEIKGTSLFAEFRKRVKKSSSLYSNILGNVSFASLPLDYSYEDEWTENEIVNHNYYDTLYVQYEDYYHSNQKRSGEGKMNILHFMTGYGIEKHYEQRNTMLALGFKLKAYFISGEINLNPETNHIVSYDISDDNEPDNDYGYIRDITNNEKWEMEGSGSIVTIDIPIGIETNITKNLSLRLGSNSVFPVYAHSSWEGSIKDEPDEIITEYTHGPDAGTTIIEVDPEQGTTTENFSSEIEKAKITLNSYYFGAGYQITDNISIDLLHFAKITDLSSWWFSVSIKL